MDQILRKLHLLLNRRTLVGVRLKSSSLSLVLYLLLVLLYFFRHGHLKSAIPPDYQDLSYEGSDQNDARHDDKLSAEPVILTPEEQQVLEKCFRGTDFDGDKTLSISEMKITIVKQIKLHITGAMRNNFKEFFMMDKLKKNGQVDWEEYYSHFIRSRLGLDTDSIQQLEKDPDNSSRYVKEGISYLKAAWSEVAKSNPNSLNIDEFLSLQHPESSHTLLISQVEDLLNKYDADSDGKITLAEYLADPFTDLDKGEIMERKDAFNRVIDEDKNGQADKREIILFLDAKNPYWAEQEAKQLVKMADKNKDGVVSLEEMLSNPDEFLNSKLVSADIGFHGEF